jgi:hypothetical protein
LIGLAAVGLLLRASPMAPGILTGDQRGLADPYQPVLLGAIAAACLLLLAIDVLRARQRPLFGLFISYRSTDVSLARELADLLIAGGVRVWFAEYRILMAHRERFQQMIDAGIRESAASIAITSDEYYDSAYCVHELANLKRRVGLPRILEVRARPLSASSVSRSPVPADQIIAPDVDGVLSLFESRSGIKVPRSVGSRRSRLVTVGQCVGRPVTVDAGHWDEIEPEGALPAFRFGPDPPTLVNIAWGEELAPEARLRETDDERAMYDALLRYAAGYMRELGSRPGLRVRGAGRIRVAGVHLLFYRGYSQFAVTYHNGMYWTRKISIVTRHPATGAMAEFVFTFGCLLPYAEYLRRTAEMDRFALSLRWE